MHVLANGEYGLQGFVFEQLIPSFPDLVLLFLVISGFGMCCGYYQKIIDQKISIEDFYKKRYSKIWPYFALLCLLDFAVVAGAFAKCRYFGDWCELDVGSDFCILYAVSVFLLFTWK